MMNSTDDYTILSSMNPAASQFDSVDSIVKYLRSPPPAEVVTSTTTSSERINNRLKSTKKIKKEKDQAKLMNYLETNSKEIIEKLPSGRVRYGPITVNPRKQPSKTLFTGRRSKYEVLSNEEEEKRRLRRERNRVAATRCREKRDSVLNELEAIFNHETNESTRLTRQIHQLEQKRLHLERLLSTHLPNCPLQQQHQPMNSIQQNQPSMVFGNPNFLSSIIETPVLPLPLSQQPELIRNHEEEDFSLFLQPTSVLTNSAYDADQSNYLFISQQQQSAQLMSMSSGSIERIINSLHTPSIIDNNNNNTTCTNLYNSAYGSSTCAQQHSSSSEDDSMTSTHQNSIVF